MAKRISILLVKQVRELAAQGKPIRKISMVLGISRNTVREYLRPAAEVAAPKNRESSWREGLPWVEIVKKRLSGYQVDQLHKQYAPEAVSYWAFNRLLKKRLNAETDMVVIVQTHKPGEKTQVDYTDGLLVYDRLSGKSRKTQLFVGVMAFSGYTFGQFGWDQKLANFIRCHEAMWHYFGGVTPYVVPDNLKSAVSKAHRYDPDVNPTFCDFGNHCGFAVLPVRPYKPRDKGMVEATIGAIQRSFYQEHREHRFYSLEELNQAFRVFLQTFNHRIMKDYGVSRWDRFIAERDTLLAVPRHPYELVEWRSLRVHPDCHVQIQHGYYSVSFRYVGQSVRAKLSDRKVEIFAETLEPIAFHDRLFRKGARATVETHLPIEKLQASQFEIKQALAMAQAIGPCLLALMEKIFDNPRPLIGLRKAQGILRVRGKDGVTPEAMEYAAGQCLTFAKLRSEFFRNCALSYTNLQNTGNRLAPLRHHDNIFIR